MTTLITAGELVIEPTSIGVLEDEAPTGNVLHRIIDRGEPDVTLREASLPTGTLRLLFFDQAEAQTARDAHRQPLVFSIATDDQPWLPASYVVRDTVRRIQQNPATLRWLLEVPYQEVTA